jgi:hypothetical protein
MSTINELTIIQSMLSQLRTLRNNYELGSEMRSYYNDVYDRLDVLESKLFLEEKSYKELIKLNENFIDEN